MESPCIKICELNENGICLGCKRTSEEIANWMFFSREERKEIIESLRKRRLSR